MYQLTIYREVDSDNSEVLLKQMFETRPTLNDKQDALIAAGTDPNGEHGVFTSTRKIKED